MLSRRLLDARVVSAVAVTLAGCGLAAPALAKSTALPAVGKKVTTCPKTVYKLGGRLAVSTAVATVKGRHPAAGLLGCANADAVALAGKKDYSKSPFKLGKQVTVGKVTYTLGKATIGRLGGKALSGPIEGWSGGGVVIFLITPSG